MARELADPKMGFLVPCALGGEWGFEACAACSWTRNADTDGLDPQLRLVEVIQRAHLTYAHTLRVREPEEASKAWSMIELTYLDEITAEGDLAVFLLYDQS